MKTIKMRIRRLLFDLKHIFLSYIVANFPSWHVRKAVYRMYGMRLGRNCRIGIGTKVINPRGISIGDRTIINEHCYLDGRDGIEIGNDTSISFGTVIITGSHVANSDDFAYRGKKVTIRDHVWIGTHAIILDGSVICSKAIIGAGSTFKGVTEESSIYAGNPAKLIKKRICEGTYQVDYRPFFR